MKNIHFVKLTQFGTEQLYGYLFEEKDRQFAMQKSFYNVNFFDLTTGGRVFFIGDNDQLSLSDTDLIAFAKYYIRKITPEQWIRSEDRMKEKYCNLTFPLNGKFQL